jgi:elastase-2
MVTSRIAGGWEATPNAFPWMAHLKVKFWSGDAAECGGILIDANHVLTAAHCLFGVISVKVTLGAHDVTSPPLSSSNQQIFDVNSGSNLKSHPDWNYGKVEDDIALIRLPYPAYFNGIILKTLTLNLK